jgi:eukaryotic-like serine/threonine-protein kinase
MEYLEGMDLGELLEERGPVPIGVAVDYVLQACEAIAEAHAAGIVHRDLKPPNLFLAQQPDGGAIVKVLDFGISKANIADEPEQGRGALTGTTDIFGSPTYMSPEQLKASRDVDARADVWALGVILYELISGRAPFDRPTVAETFGSILYEQPKPLAAEVAGVPAELSQIVQRCLEKNKEARVANVGELAKALFPFAQHTSRASMERTSSVLRRAGVKVASVPPPPNGAPARAPLSSEPSFGSRAAAGLIGPVSPARTSAGPGHQTGTGWDTASAIPPLPRSRAPLIAGSLVAVLLLAGGGALAFRKLQAPPAPVPDRPASTGQIPAPPIPSVTATATAAPADTVAPQPEPPHTDKVAPVPTSSASPHKGAGPGKHGKAVPSGTPATGPATPPPKPPVDDFGDRK